MGIHTCGPAFHAHVLLDGHQSSGDMYDMIRLLPLFTVPGIDEACLPPGHVNRASIL